MAMVSAMPANPGPPGDPDSWWLTEDDCRVEDFTALVARSTDAKDYPLADSVLENVPVYDGDRLRGQLGTEQARRDAQRELGRALSDGPGLAVVTRAFSDVSVLDRATEAFDDLIAAQHASGAVAGDHFAKPGANDRVWNALEKLAVREPAVFVDYYTNEVIALVCAAWLGPAYQMTSTVNVVNPGGAAQTAHRDYHLGFQSNSLAQQFPAQMHRCSPALTLQGAVAHCDMPVESGPTLYLPYSQRYEPGYLAWRRPEFLEYFDGHRVQLPLLKGDMVFFNPALFHAAGHNRTADVRRMANLLQVSSAFGRAMESIDRQRMANAVFPALVRSRASGVPDDLLRNAVASSAEGYGFPTNLDRDQPVGDLVPETQAALLWRAVQEGWDPADLRRGLEAHAARRSTG